MEGEGEGEGSNSRMGEQYKWEPNPYLAAMVRMIAMMMIAMMMMMILMIVTKIISDFKGWGADGDNCADSCSLLHLLPHLQEQRGRIQGKKIKGGFQKS